jgi:hypothetical protein
MKAPFYNVLINKILSLAEDLGEVERRKPKFLTIHHSLFTTKIK